MKSGAAAGATVQRSGALRLAVFDCDGTLVDSQHNIVAAMTAAWRSDGLDDPTVDAVRRVVGLPLVEAIASLHPAGAREDHERLARRYGEAWRESAARPDHEEPLYPGVAATLAALDATGVLLGVATGKSRRGLVRTLERHGLLDRFVTLKTADDGPGKPNPDMLLAAMAEAGAAPDATAMIGDTTYDVVMALRAGVPAIGVSWGYHHPDELAAAGARLVLDRFGDIPAALDNIWSEPLCALAQS